MAVSKFKVDGPDRSKFVQFSSTIWAEQLVKQRLLFKDKADRLKSSQLCGWKNETLKKGTTHKKGRYRAVKLYGVHLFVKRQTDKRTMEWQTKRREEWKEKKTLSLWLDEDLIVICLLLFC